MVTVKYPVKCDLCGQPVEIEGFSIETGQGMMAFCCAGCQSIYRLIFMSKQTDIPENNTINNEEN
ncbi:hypothetical protein MCAMS1_01675 [biofilm metagenome]